ncbi:putative protein TPRXL isoform X7 [Protopterus annectens]|uniref:putative protein TPRXL isoform X7 n=1 Tax=Protopterus annectens TaxID=7888 RepID=UPI001CFB44AE|nr:putative protein TPRXL isoform X7 [Protopterus annectens]
MEPFPAIILCLILFYCTLGTVTSSDAVHSTTQSGTVTPDTSTLSSSSEAVNTTTQSVTAIHDNSTSSSEAVHSTTQSDKVKYSNTPADSTIVTSSKVSSNSTITANTGAEEQSKTTATTSSIVSTNSKEASDTTTASSENGSKSKAVEIPSKTDNQNHDSSSKMIWLPVIVISVFVIAAIAAILKTKCKPQTVNGEDADGDITASKPSGHDVKLVSVKRTSRDFDFLLPEYYLGSENGKFEDAIMNLENTQIV